MNAAMEATGVRSQRQSAAKIFQRDGDFFFRGGGRGEALRMLGHLLRFSDLQLVLSGPEGVGKSFLMQTFCAAEQRGIRAQLLPAVEFMGIGALSERMQSLLGQDVDLSGSVQQRLETLQALSRERSEDGVMQVLLIDDAQLLSAEALEFLVDAELAARDEGGLRIVIAGDESLREHLRHSRLVERLEGKCHFLELEPFDRETAMDYLEQRLASAGLNADLFSATEMAFLIEQGRGLPGAMAGAAIRILQDGVPAAGNRTGRIQFAIPSWHWWALAVVGLLIVVALVLEPDASDPASDADPVTEVRKVEIPVIVPAQQEAATLAVRDDQAGPAPVSNDAADAASPAPSRAAVEPEPSPGEPQAVASEPVPAAAVDAAPEPVAAESQGPVTRQASPEELARERFLAQRDTDQEPVRDEEWLLQQLPGSYTVQVLGTHSRQSAEDFVARQQQPQRYTIFRTSHSGKPWFVVVHGLYADRDAAVAAIRRLPEALRRQNPWARSVESLQQAILDGRGA